MALALTASSLTGTVGVAETVAALAPPALPFCAPGPAPQTFSSTAPVAIPDVGAGSSDITVAGVPPPIVPTGSIVTHVAVRTFIRHPSPGDLDIELVSPQGARVLLSGGNGGGASDVFNGTRWDQFADPGSQVPYTVNPNLVTDHQFTPGVVAANLVPEEPLPAVGDGSWKLVVTDGVSGGSGTIDGWSIDVTTAPIRPYGHGDPPTLLDNVVPLAIGAGEPNTVTSTITVPPRNANFVRAVPWVTTSISHTRSGDLDITLRSPRGTVVTLTTDNGGLTADAFGGTTWAGAGGDRVTRHVFTGGAVPALLPEEPFGSFEGEDPVGTWTLTVHDDTAEAGGSLNGWGLSLLLDRCSPDLKVANRRTPRVAEAGREVMLRTAVTVGPHTDARDVTVTRTVPATMRFIRLTRSAGGACTAPRPGVGHGTVKCTWPGTTPVGGVRRVDIVVVPFVAGPVSPMLLVTSAIRGRDMFPVPQPTPMLVGPSRIRAANGRRCTIVGTPENDTLVVARLTTRKAVVCGLEGNDRLAGGGQGDVLDGGEGNDVISGLGGPDVLLGGAGRDNLSGGRGNDLLDGGLGADALRGGPGIDTSVGDRADARIGVEKTR